MSDKKRDVGKLKLLGKRLCLDFVNTVDWRGRESPQEFLNTFGDLLIWSLRVDTITDREAKTLSQRADKYPSEAKSVLSRAIELRETIYRIFFSIADGIPTKENDLTAFNRHLSKTMMQSHIIKTKDSFIWDSDGNKDKLDWILNPIVRSAADLLVSDELKRVKRCSDPECGWLYLDKSRNRSRRWCDMEDCGNRAKSRRFYERKKIRN